jgi:hypothetical protein
MAMVWPVQGDWVELHVIVAAALPEIAGCNRELCRNDNDGVSSTEQASMRCLYL